MLVENCGFWYERHVKDTNIKCYPTIYNSKTLKLCVISSVLAWHAECMQTYLITVHVLYMYMYV